MKHTVVRLSYSVHDIEPYINWIYFFHAWSMNGKPEEARENLRRDALRMLHAMDRRYVTRAAFGIFPANSDGDDLIIDGVRIPMLRQQHPSAGSKVCLCLADFVRPLSSGIDDKAGVFCTSVEASLTADYAGDAYEQMLAQTIADRLAEGTAEKMHEEVRRKYWGYAPDEHLTMDDTHAERYQGIRPAIGYPSLPDTSVNFILDDILDMRTIGVRLTESGMMTPHASVSGFMFAHPKARYFELGKIGEDQLRDYAHRRQLPVQVVRRFLQKNVEQKDRRTDETDETDE